MTIEEAQAKIAELDGIITGLRNENAQSRVKVRELETASQKWAGERTSLEEQIAQARAEAEKAKTDAKGEIETLNRSTGQKFANLQKRLLDEALRSRLADAIDPDVLALVDRKAIEVDPETLDFKNIDDVVKAFREAKPALFKPQDEPRRNGAPPPPRGTGTGDKTVDWSTVKPEELDGMIAQNLGVSI